MVIKHRRFQEIITMGTLGVMLSVMACEANETFDTISGPLSFEGTGSISMLPRTELDAYYADRKYVQSLTSAGQSVYVNHADPQQHRFVITRLKLSGKTPESSPQLFEALEHLKTAQAARKLALGSMAATSAAGGAWQSLHLIGPLGNEASGGPAAVMGSAIASRKDSLTYAYVDTTVWDGLGNQIGDLAYSEIFGSMPTHQVVAQGSRDFAQDSNIQTDSFMMEIVRATGEIRTSYIIGPVLPMESTALASQAEQGISGTPVALPVIFGVGTTPVIAAPVQKAGILSPIKICLERGGQDINDCTYYNGTKESGQDLTWKVRVPLKGTISISSDATYVNYRFDTDRINLLKAGTVTTTTEVALVYTQAGGGCMNGGINTPVTATDFWNSVTWSLDKRTLTWDMATDLTKWAKFSESCQLFNTPAHIYMYINFPFKSGVANFGGNITAWISNQPDYKCPTPTPNGVCVPYTPHITIVNSCLAEGTRIVTDSNTSRKIEDLRLGDKVSNPYATSLTVVDAISGTESAPMVRISDDQGHSLLLTEMHPLYVEGRGMIPAKLLHVGDPVRTDMGPSRLVRVEREDFRGKVYNLKVGNQAEAKALGVDQTAMYANGFLVGDAQIQDRHQTMETAQHHPTKSDGKLPSRWRKDYQHSLNRATSSTVRNGSPPR